MRGQARKAYRLWLRDPRHPSLRFGPKGRYWSARITRGWRALALPGSSQARYDVMPANYCLRVVPLAAGHHLLRVEYAPAGFRLGRVVSILALAIFLVLTTLVVKNSFLKHA